MLRGRAFARPFVVDRRRRRQGKRRRRAAAIGGKLSGIVDNFVIIVDNSVDNFNVIVDNCVDNPFECG